MSVRSVALRAFARPNFSIRASSFPRPAQKQRYSSATGTLKVSSSIPWVLSAAIVTAGGTWFALQPRSSAHHDEHHSKASHEEKPKAQPIHEKLEEKKDQVRESLIKPERGGNSEENHAKASEANEHKARKGKFSEEEFDNHITTHSGNPGKDFEKIGKGDSVRDPK